AAIIPAITHFQRKTTCQYCSKIGGAMLDCASPWPADKSAGKFAGPDAGASDCNIKIVVPEFYVEKSVQALRLSLTI
ncbi:MAG: hypothetical protein KA312_08625, partial [Sphingorhabdus sp.]|nr:hypothetical protein [Sphingorhabdus sp.]